MGRHPHHHSAEPSLGKVAKEPLVAEHCLQVYSSVTAGPPFKFTRTQLLCPGTTGTL